MDSGIINLPFMKAITLILTGACAMAFSSCCCQYQSMPKLHPMPKCNTLPERPAQTPVTPVKVFTQKGK